MIHIEESKIFVYDIETLQCQFLLGMKRLGTEEWHWFEVSEYRNDLDAMCKFLKEGNIGHMFGFNNLSFDIQVIQYILDTAQSWYNLSNQDIVQLIYNFAQNLIDNQNYEIRKLPYREQYLDIAQLDAFSIMGYENKNKRTSLKWIEFSLDMPIKEMPYHHSIKYLTKEQCMEIRDYCESDIHTTEKLYYIVRGQVKDSFYEGKDEIQYRIDAAKEVGLKDVAINYSGVKLGEEIVLKGFIEESGLTINNIWKKKKATKPRTTFLFGDCIPNYVSFKTKPFQDIYNKVRKKQVDIWSKEQEYPFSCNGTSYLIRKGGLHSKDPKRILQAGNGMLFRSADIGSQYPNSINKRVLFPSHMGKAWNVNYTNQILKRTGPGGYKEKGKKDNYYKGLAETWKLVLNGGSFGKSNEIHSIQYDPFMHFSVTIGNQFEILMLIESLEIAGIHITSANTDGIDTLFPEELDGEYYRVCKEWEKQVGNDKMGQLEYTDYKFMAQTSVNDYLAIGTDGKVKCKGDWSKDSELNKNKSNRIIPIALYEYFVNHIPIEDTIKNHRNIFDFCSGVKASKNYYYQGVDRKTGNLNDYDERIIRYYCSKTGERLYKIKHEHAVTRGHKRTKCEGKADYQTLFNIPFSVDKWEDYNIDYRYYINETNTMIGKIDLGYIRDVKNKEKKQMSLWE